MKSRNFTAIILAGGQSQRMGYPKALLKINNKPIIEILVESLKPHFAEIIVSANQKEAYKFLNLPVVEDEIKDQGPLMGIYSCLKRSDNSVNFVLTSDIPVIDVDCVNELLSFSNDFEVVMPINKGHLEPLFAVYSKTTISYMETVFQTNSRRIISILEFSKNKFVKTNMHRWYQNINTKHDYEILLKQVN